MAISDEFKEAVTEGKTTRARIMLKDALLLDTSCARFDEMFAYAKKQMPDLLDEHDGEIFKDRSAWNEDYLNEEMVAVVSNFSQERIDLLRSMVQKLYAKAPGKTQTCSQSEYRSIHETSGLSDLQKVGVGVAAAGAVTLVGGIVIPGAPVAVPIIGGVVMCAGIGMVIAGKE